MIYRREIPVEFCHCDPAGIVFYPRFFEMVNSVVENFFLEAVGYSYAHVVAGGNSVPTVHIEADFTAPSRLGDRLSWELTVARIGRASASLKVQVPGRLSVSVTLVWVEKNGKPAPWPDEIAQKLEVYHA